MTSPHDRQQQAHRITAHLALAARYAQLALERVGTSVRSAARATTRKPSAQPQTLRDIERDARLRTRKRLAEVFQLARERDAVDFLLGLIAEGCKCNEITAALRCMPEARSRRHGFAARIAARDALGSAPASSSTPTDRAAAILSAYHKALGRQP